jgi:hypothetical protein
MPIEIDNDNNEIRIDGYEYAATKLAAKSYGISSESSQTGNSADLRLTDSDGYTDNVTLVGGTNVTIVRTNQNTITFSAADIDTNTKYSVSAENSQTGNSADLRLTDTDGYTDNVTFTGGSNVTIVRTDANKITISASANDTNTTYGISAETNATPKSADLRLTGSDSSTDNVTLIGGTNVTITRTDANTITFSATDIDTNTKYSVSAESSQTGNSADIRLTDTDGYTDNVTITGGSNVSIVRNSANQLTVSSSYTGFGAFTDGYNTANADQAMDTINFAAGAGIKLTVDSGADKLTIDNDGVTTFNGAKGAISYNAFGAISDGYNTAIADWPMDTFQVNSGAGISFVVDGYTDSATVTNTGVTQITQGSGITISGQTGNVTVTNDGVRTFNGAKGAVSYNSFANISDGYNTASADQATDTFTIISGTGISAIVNGPGDNINISNTGVTQFNGGTGNISYYSFGSISDGYNIATADQANDSILFIPGSGIGVVVNTPGDNVTISNTGVTQATAGTGISVSAGTGNVTINNTGVTAITAGTGITTSGSGNVTVNNDGVTTFNTAKGAITYNSFGSISDGYNTATADQATDTVTFIAGTGIGVLVNGPGDSLTISNAGVTSLNGGTGARYTYSTFTDGTTPTTASLGNTAMTLTGSNGIKVTTSPNTATVSMTETSIVRGSDLTITFGATSSAIATGVIPINTTVEIDGVILLAFSNAAAVNTYTVSLTTGSGTIGANTSKVALGFAAHAGPTAGSPGETTKQAPSFTYPQQIGNTNDHTLRFSGIFQTDGTTPNNLIINIRNNCANSGENLVVYAKSFMKYNVI